MEALVLVAKVFGTGVILFLAALLIYNLMGGLGRGQEIARFGRVLTNEETFRRLGTTPARGCALIFVGAVFITYLVVWVWLRWF